MTTTAARLTAAELAVLRREIAVIEEQAAALEALGQHPTLVRRLQEAAAGLRFLLDQAQERLQVH